MNTGISGTIDGMVVSENIHVHGEPNGSPPAPVDWRLQVSIHGPLRILHWLTPIVSAQYEKVKILQFDSNWHQSTTEITDAEVKSILLKDTTVLVALSTSNMCGDSLRRYEQVKYLPTVKSL